MKKNYFRISLLAIVVLRVGQAYSQAPLTQLYRNLYINNTNPRNNTIMLDGNSWLDPFGYNPALWSITDRTGAAGGPPLPQAAIRDIDLAGQPFNVRYSNFTGNSTLLQTNKGTNAVKATVYGLGRFAAITGSDRIGGQGKMPSDFHNYTAGAGLGFPIIKDRLFFYSAAEWTGEQVPVQMAAGSQPVKDVLSLTDAQKIRNFTLQKYGWDPGSYDQYTISGQDSKFFNRLDWIISNKNQLTIRNNITVSRGENLQRDQQFFRFGSFAWEQKNTINQTTAALTTQLSPKIVNSLSAAYTYLSQQRDPKSDPSLPQVQIRGNTMGTAIFLGTDRDASIFKQKLSLYELTDDLTWDLNKHVLNFGLQGQVYNVKSAYVNSWNGRLDYLSIDDYLNGIPYQVRGNFNYQDNSRAYILSHPDARFNLGQFGLYASDQVRLSPRVQMTFGLRADYTNLFDKPTLSDKIRQAYTDLYFNNTYSYTPLNQINNHFLNYFQLSPRIEFTWNAKADKSLVLHGGAGLFSGRMPLAWLANAYTNNGNRYGNFDQKYGSSTFVSDPLLPGKNGLSDFIALNKADVHGETAGRSEINVVDNNFKLPKDFKLNVSLDYTNPEKYFFSLQVRYAKAIRDILIKNINFVDNPVYFGNDIGHQQPVFSNATDPRLNNVFEMSNGSQGYQYTITALTSHSFQSGISYLLSYTYGVNKNMADYPGNSMENVWQSNPVATPNNPGTGYSNFDIRHRIFGNLSYEKQWSPSWKSVIGLQLRAQSGVPFTWGFNVNGIQGTEQTVSLAYIPGRDEAIRFFQDVTSNGNILTTAAQQAAAFNDFIDKDKYLSSRRGKYTERNGARTPWSTQADLHLAQEWHFSGKRNAQSISLFIDIFNLTNLLNKDWGKVYYAPGVYNGTASIGLNPGLTPNNQSLGNYPVYRFIPPASPYSIDYLRSRVQGQVGLQYNF